MKLKTIVLLLAAGISTGIVTGSMLYQFSARTGAFGGELFFVPMVCLLVWFGWMIRGEFKKIVKPTMKRSKVKRYDRK